VKQEINLKTKEETTFYSVGFPLGDATTGSQQPEFNNHYRIEVQVHSKTPGEEDATYAVVGVVVYPYR
jgi:hypothetical protein